MTMPDNRMRFPAGEIDFENEVGTTGQEHDIYPEAGTQPRYDWMRMSIIALLSQQSSYEPPTQFRDGTAWFDLNEMALKIHKNGDWLPYSHAVLLEDGHTLHDLYEELRKINKVNTQFSGVATQNSTTIEIPRATRILLAGAQNVVADVFIEGRLLNSNNVSIGPSLIHLSNDSITQGEYFTVVMKNVIPSKFTLDEIANFRKFIEVEPVGNSVEIDVSYGVVLIKSSADLTDFTIINAESGYKSVVIVENIGASSIDVNIESGTVSGTVLDFVNDFSVSPGERGKVEVIIL